MHNTAVHMTFEWQTRLFFYGDKINPAAEEGRNGTHISAGCGRGCYTVSEIVKR